MIQSKEITELFDQDIKDQLLDQIKQSPFFAIQCDETTDMESVLSVCITLASCQLTRQKNSISHLCYGIHIYEHLCYDHK